MTNLVGSDGRLVAAPRTVTAESYPARRFDRDGCAHTIILPAGTEVRQTLTDSGAGQMQARIDGAWVGVKAP